MHVELTIRATMVIFKIDNVLTEIILSHFIMFFIQ